MGNAYFAAINREMWRKGLYERLIEYPTFHCARPVIFMALKYVPGEK